MYLQVVVIFSMFYFASARQNYWGNEVCFSDSDCAGFTCDIQFGCTGTPVGKTFWNTHKCNSNSDCTGLTSCHPTFGCTISFVKTTLVVVSVMFSLSIMSCAVRWLIIRFWRKRHRHVPQSPVMPTNPPLWNQDSMRTTTMFHPQHLITTTTTFHPQTSVGYPYQPVTNDDPPSYNECQISVSPQDQHDNKPSHGHST